MKILVPNEDKLNNVSPPEGDDDSVDTEIGTPDSIEKVPDLPENYDEELLNHRSNRSSIPIRKSSRPQRDANVWEALDPTKSKLDQEIDTSSKSQSQAEERRS